MEGGVTPGEGKSDEEKILLASHEVDETPGVVLDYLLITSASINIDFAAPTSDKMGPAAIGLNEWDYWNPYSFPNQTGPCTLTDLAWSDGSISSGTDLTVENAPGAADNGVGDAMYSGSIYPWNSNPVTVTLSSVSAGTYDLYVYGHGTVNDANSVFELSVGGQVVDTRGTTPWGPGWNSTFWEEGEQYVVFRDVTVNAGQSLVLSVQAGWDGYARIAGLQLIPIGSVTPENPTILRLINVDLSGTVGAKVGPAAVGQGASDQWNTYNQPYSTFGSLSSLKQADGTVTSVNMTVANGPGAWGNGHPDAMYNGYLYPWNGGHVMVTFTGLPDGIYDVLTYGHSPDDAGHAVFSVSSGSVTHGPRGTTQWGPGWASTEWQESQQYVAFRGVAVSNGAPLYVDVIPGTHGYAMIAGLQIVALEDGDRDTLPDAWEWAHFGTLNETADGDYDEDGATNGDEYANDTDPNTIVFSVLFPNKHVSSSTASGTFTVDKGEAASMAVLVDDSDLENATWTTYNPSIDVNLGTGDGWKDIRLGLRGRTEDSEQTWQQLRLKLDTMPADLVLTNPIPSTTSIPLLQLQGYSSEALAGLTFDLSNANGTETDLPGHVLAQRYDTNTFEFTTNWWQCFDLELAEGANQITVHATDLAGNTASTSLSVTLDYSGDSTSPVLTLTWPQDGDTVSGSTVTLRGQMDDPAATVTAEIVDSGGTTHTINGLVERTGTVWLLDLPLEHGANSMTLTTTDAAGNADVSVVSITRSTLELAIDDLPESELNLLEMNVSGTVSDTSYAVWANGVEATVNGDGTWTASSVPVNEGGTAVIQATAYPPGEHPGSGEGGNGQNPSRPNAIPTERSKDKPPTIRVMRCFLATSESQFHPDYPDSWWSITYHLDWHHGEPSMGSYRYDNANGYYKGDYSWPEDQVPTSKFGTLVHTDSSGTFSGPADPAWVQIEQREVYEVTKLADGSINTFSGHIQAPVALLTGGKGIPSRLHLCGVISTLWRGVYNFKWPAGGPVSSEPMLPDEYMIGILGHPDENFVSWDALPDNISVSASPIVLETSGKDLNLFGTLRDGQQVETLDPTKDWPVLAFRLMPDGGWRNIDPLTPSTPDVIPYKTRIGVIRGDTIEFKAWIYPNLEIPDEMFVWSGEKSGTGPILEVTFDTLGEHTQTVSVKAVKRKAVVKVIEIPEPNQDTWAQQNLFYTPVVLACKVQAEQWAESLCNGHNNNPVHNCRADAVRHAFWTGQMTLLLGQSVAMAAATAHERTNLESGATHNEIVMDMENSEAGCQIFASITFPGGATDQEKLEIIKAEVKKAADEGKLTVLDQLLNPPELGLLIDSNEQPY